ncbi:MAG TPA: MFS transporter, partial [Anaerolineaceae bacterium]
MKLPARQVYVLLSASSALFNALMFTVLPVYFVTTVRLDALQLVLVGTVLEGSVLLLEVPTGVLADTYSRRLSVIAGMAALGAGFLLTGLAPHFGWILAAQVINGLGYTLLSGALDAWLAGEIGAQAVGTMYLRAGQIARVSGVVGVLGSMYFGSIYPGLPYTLGGALYLLLAGILAVIMPETGFVKSEARAAGRLNPLRDMQATFRAGAAAMRGSPLLIGLAGVVFFLGASSEGWDRLAEPHLLTGFGLPFGDLPPVVWLGAFEIASLLVTLGVVEALRRRLERVTGDTGRTARWLLGVTLGFAALSLLFALAGPFWLAITVYMLRGTLRSVLTPLYDSWVVQHVDARVRATMISMINQTDALGQIAGGPVV